jgi:hypothetical protein
MDLMARHTGELAVCVQIPLQRDCRLGRHPDRVGGRGIHLVAPGAEPIHRVGQSYLFVGRAKLRHADVAFLASAVELMFF